MNLCEKLFEKYSKKVTIAQNGYRIYSKDEKQRYYYYKELSEKTGGKKVTVIMINPSENKEENEKENNNLPDNTINNLYNILKTKNTISTSDGKNYKISSFEVINLFSCIESTPNKVLKDDIVNDTNRQILEYVIKEADIIIPAWGIENKFNYNAKALLKDIKKWCSGKTIFIVVNKFPCHFSTQCTSTNRKPEFVEYNFN